MTLRLIRPDEHLPSRRRFLSCTIRRPQGGRQKVQGGGRNPRKTMLVQGDLKNGFMLILLLMGGMSCCYSICVISDVGGAAPSK
jgi:hypothetical protein